MKSKNLTSAAPLFMSVLLAACGASDNSSSGSASTPEPQVPTALAQNLSFSDTDLAREKVAGILSFQAPDHSQDIREYSVYWSDGLNPTGKISTIDAAGILEIHLSADLSPYPFLMVYSENNAGDRKSTRLNSSH